MPRQGNVSAEYNFNQGLVTEATGLNFPENACTETYNCVFDSTGPVSKRPQIDFEDSYTTETITRSNLAISSYLWKGVGSTGDFSLVVVQIGNTLYFYRTDEVSLSRGLITGSTVNLASFHSAATSQETQECTYATGLGYLFVFHPGMNPIYISYNATTDVLTASAATLRIRDLVGLDDGKLVDERPTTQTTAHRYNTYNQGWNVSLNGTSPYSAWDTARADFPSNADVWWDFKNQDNVFDLTYVANYSRGTTPAPKGYYVLDLFNQDRTTASGISSITTVTYTERPSTGEFFAGRVWYSGISNNTLSNKIYFSQVIENINQLGNCYQKYDPTSEDLSIILPTDGGEIVIPDMGTVRYMKAVGNYLLLFASNGIWGITGSQGIGFIPTDYSIIPISDVGSVSASNFVDTKSAVLWWNDEGIYALTLSKDGFSIKNLSEERIKEFYSLIPIVSKKQSKGSYNVVDGIITWLYRTTLADDVTSVYEYDAALKLDVKTSAFYPWTFCSESGCPRINSVIASDVLSQSVTSAFNVIDGSSNNVIDASGNNVVAFSYSTYATNVTKTKYLTSYPSGGSYKFTWSEELAYDSTSLGNFLDWYKYDSVGKDYDAYFISGYKLRGEGQRKFHPSYIYLFSDTEENLPTYDVSAIWDYSTAPSTGRWPNRQRVSFSSSDYNFQRRRLKVRGNGLTVQFKCQGISGEPMNITGWSLFETSGAVI